MKKILILFSFIIVINLEGWSQCDSPFYRKYISKGDSVLAIIKRKGGTAEVYKSAINHYNTAMLVCPDSAEKARVKILEVFKEIQKLKEQAVKASNEAFDQKTKAELATKGFKFSTWANAPYKYVRLILDGPEDVEKIKKDSFDLKLIAYCNHLDILGDSITKYCDSTSLSDYNMLMDKLYYDNGLYEKVYYCLKSINPEDTVVLKPYTGKRPGFNVKKFTDGNKNYTVELEKKKISITRNSEKEILTPQSGQQFISFTLSPTLKRLFCSTDDNFIYVYSFFDSIKPKLLADETIAMGSRITAMDFKEDSSVLFFGTVKGDIGFIRYNSDRKNQPVYDVENSLGSEVTSIGFFTHKIGKDKPKTFLLATGQRSRSSVFELDSNYLTPNYKFMGNFLPRRGLGNINHAVYDAECKKVIVETKRDDIKDPSLWEWNPFSREILEGLKAVKKAKLQNNEIQIKPDQFMNKSQVKFY